MNTDTVYAVLSEALPHSSVVINDGVIDITTKPGYGVLTTVKEVADRLSLPLVDVRLAYYSPEEIADKLALGTIDSIAKAINLIGAIAVVMLLDVDCAAPSVVEKFSRLVDEKNVILLRSHTN